VNSFLFLSSKCSTDLCRRFLPSSAIIITEYNKGDINKDRIDLFIHRNNSIQIIIAQLIDNKVNRNLVFIEFNSSFFCFFVKNKNHSLKNDDIRTHQIVFQYEQKNYFNMMCE